MFINPNPDCQKECRFGEFGGATTLMYTTPVFDKHGINVNQDMNTTTYEMRCSTCKRQWIVAKKPNSITIKEITKPV